MSGAFGQAEWARRVLDESREFLSRVRDRMYSKKTDGTRQNEVRKRTFRFKKK